MVPTYREVESLPHLIDRIAKVREEHGLDLDVVIMDDDSRDGSVELIAARREPWVSIVVRTADRGLSPAVIEGLKRARGEVLVCMDADLSHPPEELPKMMDKLDAGADFVVGSRYASGGGTASALWRQILADVLGAEIATVDTTEGAAYGAALLAAVGAGWFPTVDAAVAAVVHASPVATPGRAAAASAAAHATYRELYPALAPSFHRLSG